MIRRFVLLLFALSPIVIADSVHSQAREARSSYVPITLCELSFHHEKQNPKYISVDAEYVSAIPHGLYLIDRHCAKKAIQIDFADTGLDPSVAVINDHLWEIQKATGTFRGMLKRHRDTKRLYLWLESVVNFQPAEYLPAFDKGEPIRLPEPTLPKWPPTL
jgi:hypothetical protein